MRVGRSIVSHGRPAPNPNAHEVDATPRSAGGISRSWTWAALIRRVVDLVLTLRPGQRPFQFGLRFSANARGPSTVSSERRIR